MGTPVGQLVGYHIGQKGTTDLRIPRIQLKYYSVLRVSSLLFYINVYKFVYKSIFLDDRYTVEKPTRCEKTDKKTLEFTNVILDEAHGKTIDNDLCMVFCRILQNKDVKIIVKSATIDIECIATVDCEEH